MAKDERDRSADEWREVQDHRYDKGFYPGSGKINPFFRKLGGPDRRFGIQLLVVGALIAVLPPLFGLREWPVYVSVLVIAAICVIGGVGHVRAARSRQ
jgi:hypothetical protein